MGGGTHEVRFFAFKLKADTTMDRTQRQHHARIVEPQHGGKTLASPQCLNRGAT